MWTLNSSAHAEIVAKLLARRLKTRDVASEEDDDFGLSDENSSDFESEGIESYLPRADPELSLVENSRAWQRWTWDFQSSNV